jgi:hypothetical protein
MIHDTLEPTLARDFGNLIRETHTDHLELIDKHTGRSVRPYVRNEMHFHRARGRTTQQASRPSDEPAGLFTASDKLEGLSSSIITLLKGK